jgi:ribosomal protein S12 methylthiotransferase
MVGFPGETEAEFDELMDFIREVGFDRLGAFCYCPEAGTCAASLPNQVPEDVKQRRYDALMTLQAEIALARNLKLVGTEQDVIVDKRLADKAAKPRLLLGRTRGQAPDIDGGIRLRGKAAIGDIVRSRVTGADAYDLDGIVLAR